MKKFFGIISLILVLLVSANVSTAVNAEKVAEVVTPATSTSKSINISQVSTTTVTYGYSVTLKAMSRGLDTKKCQYAFYYKYQGESWTTIQSYTDKTMVDWTPEKIGQYEVCIKILCDSKVYKKYFDIIASEELVNLSVVSSSHIRTGDTVTLTAKATGGLGGYTFAYYSKRAYSDWWTMLNDYKEANSMQWKPSESGEYDICIKAKDDYGQVTEKYFTLTVENEGIKTPAQFSLELKAPIFAPYQWSCDISDEEVIGYTGKTEYHRMSVAEPILLLEYGFKTMKMGTSSITMNYQSYNGKVYNIVYDITVDKNLNYTVNSVSGTYFEKELPEIEQKVTDFSLEVQNAPDGYNWHCDVSNMNVIEIADIEKGYSENYRFRALRKGFATIRLSCVSPSDTDMIYQLIYNVSVDEEQNVTVNDYDGYYIEDYWLPQIQFN